MTSSYFSYFDLASAFDVNIEALDKKYLELQSKTHPDKFATKSPDERMKAAQETVNINQAYQTLKSPLKRAVYLLQLQEIEAFEEQKTLQDKTLLLETLEAQEKLADATTAQQLSVLQQDADQLQQTLLAKLSTAFQQNNLQDAKNLTIRLKYNTKQMDDIRQKQFDLIKSQAS